MRADGDHIRLGDESGASAVEFALVAMLLIVLLTGIMQFGFIFMQYLEVVHAAREGARWASLAPPEGVGSVGETGSVKDRVSQAAPALGPPLSDADITVIVGGDERDGSGAGEQIYQEDSGATVEVRVSYQSTLVLPPMNLFIGDDGILMSSTAVHRVE